MKRGWAMLAAALALVGGAADGHTISPVVVTDLDGHDIAVPANLPGGRTLIILGFHHADQAIVAAWKTGLAIMPRIDGVKSGQMLKYLRHPSAFDACHCLHSRDT